MRKRIRAKQTIGDGEYKLRDLTNAEFELLQSELEDVLLHDDDSEENLILTSIELYRRIISGELVAA